MTAATGNRAASATWLTGSTFIGLATPLALFGAQPLDVSLAGLTLRGQVDDYAIQYLGAAALVGLGVGASRLQGDDESETDSSSDSSPAIDSQPTSGEIVHIPELDSSVLTEASLKASGLEAFLDDDDAPLVIRPIAEEVPFSTSPVAVQISHHQTSEVPQPNISQSVAAQPTSVMAPPSVKPVDKSFTQPGSPLQQESLATPEMLASIVAEVQTIVQQMSLQPQAGEAVPAPVVPTTKIADQNSSLAPVNPTEVRVGCLPLVSHHHKSPLLPSAQSYVSFARPQAAVAQPAVRDLQAEMAVLDQVYQIREQMQSLMNQLDMIQADLEQTMYPTQRLVPLKPAQAPSYTVSAVEPFREANPTLPPYGQIAS